eukprot:Tamp_17394.p1 GENE.Tamp_17394~~Tamp_17394.p1  ORF type:complete len:350 (-),score=92.72 Tamp_17394:70-1119(-)
MGKASGLALLAALAALAAVTTLVATGEAWRPANDVLLARPPFNPAAVAQQLAQIASRQRSVLTAQEKLVQESKGSPAAQAAQLAAKDLPYRLAGWTTPGTPSAAPVPYTGGASAASGAARLHGYSTGQVANSGASPWSGGGGASAGGAARLHGYSTGQVANGGASPWSGGGAAPPAPMRLGGGWKPTARAAARDVPTEKGQAARAAAQDFSTKEGREARRRVSLRLKDSRRAAQQQLRRVVGKRPVEKLNIVVTKAKPAKVMPLEFSKGTKALFSGLQDFASQNLPRPATYSDPYGGALAQPLPRAFYSDGPHPDAALASSLVNQLSAVGNTQDRFHYASQVYHFAPHW